MINSSLHYIDKHERNDLLYGCCEATYYYHFLEKESPVSLRVNQQCSGWSKNLASRQNLKVWSDETYVFTVWQKEHLAYVLGLSQIEPHLGYTYEPEHR